MVVVWIIRVCPSFTPLSDFGTFLAGLKEVTLVDHSDQNLLCLAFKVMKSILLHATNLLLLISLPFIY
jgi:hypothetical protein